VSYCSGVEMRGEVQSATGTERDATGREAEQGRRSPASAMRPRERQSKEEEAQPQRRNGSDLGESDFGVSNEYCYQKNDVVWLKFFFFKFLTQQVFP